MKPDCLNGLPFVRKFIHLENIDSTNLFGRSLEDIPESGITVIQADNQSSGRGRLGNSFFSSHSGGLWVSIITPISDLSRHFQFNRAISLAIHDSILKLFPDSPLGIKWPNDIYWAERKICGILLENHLFHPEFLVIGFGINVNIKPAIFRLRSKTGQLRFLSKPDKPSPEPCSCAQFWKTFISTFLPTRHLFTSDTWIISTEKVRRLRLERSGGCCILWK